MGSKRIHQIAKEYNISSEALMSILRELNFPVKSHMSLVDEKMLKAIAEKLFVSPGTIKTHTLSIYQKMEVSNRTSASLKAIELNWFV